MRKPIQALKTSATTLFQRSAWGALLCAPVLCLSSPAVAQGRPDQVFYDGGRQDSGVVTENGLSNVLLDRSGKEKRIASANVVRIIWGQVSNAYREGGTYFERGDYENAAAKFGLAASDDARNVIRAVARMKTGESLLMLGAGDASQYEAALEQFATYVKDYPNSRDLPNVYALQARTTLLRGKEGDSATAGAIYRKIFESGTGATPADGYNRLFSMKAGLGAIRALTSAGDTLGAREISGILTGEITHMRTTLEADSSDIAVLDGLASEAQLSEGFVLLAGDQASKAETFFMTQLAGSQGKASALRYGSMFGLGLAQVAQNKHREASVNFATVAATDFTDRDRSALALLHLAETMIKLGDNGATADARVRLRTVAEAFGDTPSAAAARKLLEEL